MTQLLEDRVESFEPIYFGNITISSKNGDSENDIILEDKINSYVENINGKVLLRTLAPEVSKNEEKRTMEEYQPQTREEMQDAIKDVFGPMFEAMLQGEMDSHLRYGRNERREKETTNKRNGYSHKSVNSAYGKLDACSPAL